MDLFVFLFKIQSDYCIIYYIFVNRLFQFLIRVLFAEELSIYGISEYKIKLKGSRIFNNCVFLLTIFSKFKKKLTYVSITLCFFTFFMKNLKSREYYLLYANSLKERKDIKFSITFLPYHYNNLFEKNDC